MLTYSEKAAVDAVKATRQILGQGYIAKSKYDEDVAGINRKFETISTSTDSKISSKLAEFKQGIDGQVATIVSQLDGVLKKQTSTSQMVRSHSVQVRPSMEEPSVPCLYRSQNPLL